jgi:hypothetical protein
MMRHAKKLKFPIPAMRTAFLALVILMFGCGPSYEERQAQKEAEGKEQLRQEQAEEERKIAEVERRFNAVYFPPPEITATSFTYEIQKFFKMHADDPIVFKGYLEDVVASQNDVLVEFVCPIGELYFLAEMSIRFKLTLPENNVGEFLEAKRSDPMIPSLRYLDEPDYFVIAKILNVQIVRKYEFDGHSDGEDVEIEAELLRSLVGIGRLIKTIAIPKNDKEGP